MKFAAKSDIGMSRKINEDNFCLIQNKNGDYLACVCDGIGGSKAGEVASLLAVTALKDAFLEAADFTKDYQVNEFIQHALNQANDIIYNRSLHIPNLRGMGTTACGILICKCGSYIFNVGDSRLYAGYYDGFIQMSEDHSVIAKLLREGSITSEEAKNHEQRNTLTNALGVWKVFRIDINKIQSSYEYILICSDGLSGYVDEKTIEEVVLSSMTPEEKAQKLVDLANEQGGMDNCTVIVIENDQESGHD